MNPDTNKCGRSWVGQIYPNSSYTTRLITNLKQPSRHFLRFSRIFANFQGFPGFTAFSPDFPDFPIFMFTASRLVSRCF